LDRTPDFDPGLGLVAISLAAVALVALAIVSVPAIGRKLPARRIALVAAAIGVCATLIAPAAYAIDTTGIAYGGGDPHPGPGAASSNGGGFGGFGGGFGGGGGQSGAGGLRGDGGGIGGNSSDTALLQYLVANKGTAKWIVAVNSSQEAGSIEIATGLPVMAMGGFSGSDPTPTLDELKGYVAAGELRFVIASGGMGGFGGGSSSVSSWVASTCTAVSYGGTASLYDCAGAGQ
jgi:hypothetical protein